MKSRGVIIIAFVVVLILFNASTFVVSETEQVLITQFGKPVGEPINKPGLNFKIPFIQTANKFDKRIMEWDGAPEQVPTKGTKFVFIDTYARWRITDPLKFFQRLKNIDGALSRIDDILDGETRNFVAANNFIEVIRSSNRKPLKGDTTLALPDSLAPIKVGRKKIQAQILEAAKLKSGDLGIEILDLRLKRVNYAEKDKQKVYDRMISEQKKIADKLRSEGQGAASRINGEKIRDLKEIQSIAFRESEEIKGKADATAARVYAEAYDRSSQSRELYSFLKSMETYGDALDSKTSVILSTDSEMFKYLKSSK